jgi:hypothetical protein
MNLNTISSPWCARPKMNESISLICESLTSHFCVHPIGHKTTFHKKSNGQTFSRLYMMCHVNRDTSCPFYHKHINTSNNQSIRITTSNNPSIYLKFQFYIFLLKFPKKIISMHSQILVIFSPRLNYVFGVFLEF